MASYDFTGVDSVTTTVNTTGVDGNADIFLGVASTGRDSKRITANGTYDLIPQRRPWLRAAQLC